MKTPGEEWKHVLGLPEDLNPRTCTPCGLLAELRSRGHEHYLRSISYSTKLHAVRLSITTKCQEFCFQSSISQKISHHLPAGIRRHDLQSTSGNNAQAASVRMSEFSTGQIIYQFGLFLRGRSAGKSNFVNLWGSLWNVGGCITFANMLNWIHLRT